MVKLRLLVYASLAFAVFSCTNGGGSNNTGPAGTTSAASGAGAVGIGNDADTTGLNRSAAQPEDAFKRSGDSGISAPATRGIGVGRDTGAASGSGTGASSVAGGGR